MLCDNVLRQELGDRTGLFGPESGKKWTLYEGVSWLGWEWLKGKMAQGKNSDKDSPGMCGISNESWLHRDYLWVRWVAHSFGCHWMMVEGNSLLGAEVPGSDLCPSSVPSSVIHVHLITRRKTRNTNPTASPSDSLCSLPSSTAMAGGLSDCSLTWVPLFPPTFKSFEVESFPTLV